MERAYEKTFKVVLVGDANAGKTALLHRFVHGHFDQQNASTIGVDFMRHPIVLEDGRKITLTLWDTAGQERFAQLTKTYWRDADAIIAVFDVTSNRSLSGAVRYLKTIYDDYGGDPSNEHPFRVLLGTKSDLSTSDAIAQEQMRIVHEGKAGIVSLYDTCSSKTGDNINAIFTRLADQLSMRNFNSRDDTVSLHSAIVHNSCASC